MPIDYKRELEAAAKSMILIHDPEVLIKMIVRMIVQRMKVKHAAILLYHEDKNSYILTVSRGQTGLKLPVGFARMDTDNALIKFFIQKKDKEVFGDGLIIYEDTKRYLGRRNINKKTKQLLRENIYQMEIFDVVACVPSYFQDSLLGILLLGKKVSGRRFKRKELDFFVALASDVAMAIRNAQLFEQIHGELDKRQQLFINMVTTLGAAIEAKDHYTRGHTGRVTNLSLKIAQKLIEKTKVKFYDKFLEHLQIAALLHDIGKIGVPEDILNKNGKLTDEERKKIQLHSTIGATILQPIKELEECILGVKYHHERYDGKGYPEGLKGDEIPLVAAVIAGADAYDAMTTDRPYRKAMTKEDAINEIKRASGQQFAPQIVDMLIGLYQEGEL